MAQNVTILGAGAIGLCTALSLAERGISVRLIDRGVPGQEASFGNAGVISPWSFVPQSLPGIWKKMPALMFGKHRPLSVRAGFWPRMLPWGLQFVRNSSEAHTRQISDAMEPLCAPSVDLYRRHLDGTGQEHLIKDCAYVHAFRDDNPDRLKALDYRIRQEKGAELELVGQNSLHKIEPALSQDFKAAVLIHGQARAQSPGQIMTAMANKAERLGVDILQQTVTGIRRTENGWEIDCSGMKLSAPRVIVAMGAWSADLLKPLGISVPLVAERGYHVEFPIAGIELQNSVMDTDAKFVASSMEGGLRVAGQAEFAHVDAPEDMKKAQRMQKQAKAAFPDLKVSEPRYWMGSRPSFPDSLPMIGEFGGLKGLYAGFGHSHYGLMMAPKTGELLADLITGRTPNFQLAAYSAERFNMS